MNDHVDILLVDDDKNLTEGLRRALRHENYQIHSATSGAEAAAILVRQDIAVVVTDNQMPGIHGIDLLVQLRSELPDVPRILMTGNPTVELAMRAINEASVFRFFVKPLNIIELAVCIREVLSATHPRPSVNSLVEDARMTERLQRSLYGATGVQNTSDQ